MCITVGNYLASDMARCYDKKFETIYSCMSSNLGAKNEDINKNFWHEKFSLPLLSKIAVFQGSMTTLRNLDNLAKATKYLDENNYLVIVGGGPYEQEFRNIVEKEGNPQKVFYAGWVNQNELLKYTINADLGVLPYAAVDEYFSYSVPNKLMEYFEVSIPMLYDKSMKEISMVAGEHSVGVGADLTNPEEFGNKINELLNSEVKLSELKHNYNYCKDKFRYEKQKEHFEKLLEDYFEQGLSYAD